MLTLNPQPDGASLLRCYSGKRLLAGFACDDANGRSNVYGYNQLMQL